MMLAEKSRGVHVKNETKYYFKEKKNKNTKNIQNVIFYVCLSNV